MSQSGAPKAVRIPMQEHIEYAEGGIVSKTLLDKKAGTLTLFAFDAGQGLSEHTSPYDATVQVVEGNLAICIGSENVEAGAGDLVIMPASVPHSLRAVSRCKMLLIMIREKKSEG